MFPEARISAALGVVLGLLSACASSAGRPSGVVAPLSPPASAASSSPRTPCTSPALHRVIHLRVAGVRRSVRVSADRSAGRRPLVLLFHGFDETARWIGHYTRLPRLGRRRGWIVASLQGLDDRWNFQSHRAVGPNDVAFARAVVRLLEHQECAMPGRIFATGFSDGADMANAIACRDSSQVTAVAGVAASVVPRGCNQPVDVLEVHGTADPVVPFDGGGAPRPPPFAGATPVSTRAQLSAWRAVDECSSVAASSHLSGTVIEKTWNRCRSTKTVVMLVVEDGGHTWPGSLIHLPYGRTDRSVSASEQILNFFSDL